MSAQKCESLQCSPKRDPFFCNSNTESGVAESWLLNKHLPQTYENAKKKKKLKDALASLSCFYFARHKNVKSHRLLRIKLPNATLYQISSVKRSQTLNTAAGHWQKTVYYQMWKPSIVDCQMHPKEEMLCVWAWGSSALIGSCVSGWGFESCGCLSEEKFHPRLPLERISVRFNSCYPMMGDVVA